MKQLNNESYKIVCILPICTYPTNNNSIKGIERINQYIIGLNKFFEYLEILNKYNVDVIIFDNTINSNQEIPIEILNIIPEKVRLLSANVNEYGRINKGAGLIECWKYLTTTLSEYDFLIHFEPRQLLINFNFIQNFLDNPQNLFTYSEDKIQFNTGLFCISCKILLVFINSVNIQVMTLQYINIEYLFFVFFKEHNIPYSIEDKMGLIWFRHLETSLFM